jgi:cell division protein FtsN
MLKFIFICLLIANALLIALWQGYIANPVYEPRQPQRLSQQEAASHLKLISADEATAPVKPEIKEQPKQQTFACLEWGNFQTADISKVEDKLKALAFGSRQSRVNVQDNSGTMVYIPPLGSKEAADKKALELTHLGVHDFYIVQDQSNMRWSISLGVFKTEEAAKQQLANLVAKGVHSARIGVHSAETNKFNFLFRNVTGSERSDLDNLKTDFPNQDLHLCKTA